MKEIEKSKFKCSNGFQKIYVYVLVHLDFDVEQKYDLENEVVKDPNNSPGELQKNNITTLFELQQQYQQELDTIIATSL